MPRMFNKFSPLWMIEIPVFPSTILSPELLFNSLSPSNCSVLVLVKFCPICSTKWYLVQSLWNPVKISVVSFLNIFLWYLSSKFQLPQQPQTLISVSFSQNDHALLFLDSTCLHFILERGENKDECIAYLMHFSFQRDYV